MYLSILEWLLPLIGAGGLGSAITYLFTFKSKKRIVLAEAEESEIEVLHKRMDLRQDECDYLLKQCDKYITDYHELETEFRLTVKDLQELLSLVVVKTQKEIQDKCIEIATLKSKIAYLDGVKCYNFLCQHRVIANPNQE